MNYSVKSVEVFERQSKLVLSNSMKNLKHILSLAFVLNVATITFAQRGIDVIRKAESKYENGEKIKALKLLSRAEQMDYGFCGNAGAGADRAISLLRTKIYIDQKDYQLARNCLDSIGWEYITDNLDSIRIRTYQFEYGKDSLNKMIDTSFLNVKMEYINSDYYVIVPLTNGKTMKLKVNPLANHRFLFITDEKKKLEKWIADFKASQNYKLIREQT